MAGQVGGLQNQVLKDSLSKRPMGAKVAKTSRSPGSGRLRRMLGIWCSRDRPAKPDTLYAGGYAGASKSTDGGASWKIMSSGLSLPPMGFTGVNALAVDPHDKNVACATINGRVFRSADGAATWSEVNPG